MAYTNQKTVCMLIFTVRLKTDVPRWLHSTSQAFADAAWAYASLRMLYGNAHTQEGTVDHLIHDCLSHRVSNDLAHLSFTDDGFPIVEEGGVHPHLPPPDSK